MSDNSHSTGSSGSSTNSWTLLSPEEAAVENVGPVDDGTESLGDVPSLSEDVTGAAAEFKPSDIPLETVLSEEGHQVCQETSPESSLGPIPSSPSRLSPLIHTPLDPPDLDLESQAPVIHDIVTSSPGDNEPLGATPFVTNIDLDGSLDIPAAELQPAEPEEESCSEIPVSAEPVIDAPVADVTLIHARESPVEIATETLDIPTETLDIPTETLTAADPLSHVEADIDVVPESTEQLSLVVESLEAEGPIDVRPTPETVGSAESVEEAEVETMTQEEIQQEEEEVVVEEVASSGLEWGDTSSFDDDGLRRRNVTFEGPRLRTSDEEDEEEEMEFRLAEKKEEKPFFSLNKCIVGSLILLFLGSLFLSGDFDGSDDGEQGQDWLSSDPQEMKELLDKLTQENQQIAQLEAQLRSQKENLDLALRAKAASGDENGQANLEKENTKLKEELSFLPELKKELESLRVRVTELSQLTDDQEMPPSSSGSAPQPSDKDGLSSQKAPGPEKRKATNMKEELQRQKGLLEESRKRLQGMKKDGGDRKRGVRDSLEEIQKKLSEQVERWGKKKPQTESKWKGNKGQKTNGRDHWKKDEKKEWRGEKDGKRGKEEKKEWKSEKPNSHKEAWRKHQDEWDRKKGERRTDREDRRQEKPWHSRPGKNSHSHHQHHQDHQQQQHHHQQQQQQQHQQQQARQQSHNDFWKDQEQKLRRNVLAQLACRSVEDCAAKEGLYPVELSEFEELLEGYLSKLEGSSAGSKDKIRKLTAEFFDDGVFIHDRVLFSDFAEDVADILEDMVDVLQKDDEDALEEQMEEFEREALWKFAATT